MSRSRTEPAAGSQSHSRNQAQSADTRPPPSGRLQLPRGQSRAGRLDLTVAEGQKYPAGCAGAPGGAGGRFAACTSGRGAAVEFGPSVWFTQIPAHCGLGTAVGQVVLKGTQRDLCDSPADQAGRAWLLELLTCVGRREPRPRYRRQSIVEGATAAQHVCTFRSSIQPERGRRRDEASALNIQAPARHACRIALNATVKQLHAPAGPAEDGAASAGNI
eukprot:2733614-Prymnesium_polylepis.2